MIVNYDRQTFIVQATGLVQFVDETSFIFLPGKEDLLGKMVMAPSAAHSW
jgi:hypothetical protein